MASGKPIVKQISILPTIIQLVYMLGLFFLFNLIFPHGENNIIFSWLAYLLLALIVRNIFSFHHRKGVRYYKKGNYVQAIPEFLKSYDFYTKHNWLDKYRSVFLMSASRISYKEMALINAAFCYAQTGDGKNLKSITKKHL